MGNEGELDSANVPVVIQLSFQVTEDSPMNPYVAVGFEPDELTGEEADRYFREHRDAFIEVCRTVAIRHQPELFLVGIEVNRYYEKSPLGFDDFLDVYEELYREIKKESPDTRVGSNFLLEFMKGAGARSGTQHEPHWGILDRFEPQLDVVTFTLYPFLDVDHPSDIQDDYLTEILQYTQSPLMITETGWPSQEVSTFSEIQAGEDIQVAYLDRLLELTESVPLHALIWAFPHDPEIGIAGGLFDHISMKRNDGSPKPVFDDWQKLIFRPLTHDFMNKVLSSLNFIPV